MARAPRQPPRRSPRRTLPAVERGPFPYQLEALAGSEYTAAWHRVRDWALETVAMYGEPRELVARNPRVAIVIGQAVEDLHDADEAEHVAIDLGLASILELGPPATVKTSSGRAVVGGRRRVIVRTFTWQVDETAGVLHSPQWITTGEGLSARAASADHNRYIRDYVEAVDEGVNSRLLSATAVEVLFWTMSKDSPFV